MRWTCRVLCNSLALMAGLRAQSPQVPETNPFTSDADIQQGAALFQTHCSYCHGSFGEAAAPIDRRHLSPRRTRPGAYTPIRYGIPGSEMAPGRVTDDEVWKLVVYVKGLGSQGLLEKAPGDPAAGRQAMRKADAPRATRSTKTAVTSARTLPISGVAAA